MSSFSSSDNLIEEKSAMAKACFPRIVAQSGECRIGVSVKILANLATLRNCVRESRDQPLCCRPFRRNGRGPLSGRLKNRHLLFPGAAVLYLLYPAFQFQNGHEVDDSLCWNFCLERSGETKLKNSSCHG